MPARAKKRAPRRGKAPTPEHVEAIHIPVAQTDVSIKIIERAEPEPEQQDLDTVATLLAHAIEQPGIGGKLLGRTVGLLAKLPPWLSPLTGLIGPSIRNGLDLLEALPRLPALVRPRVVKIPRKTEEPRPAPSVQKIQIK